MVAAKKAAQLGVAQLDPTKLTQKHILRLQIAMRDSARVDVAQRLEDLHDKRPRVVFRQSALVDDVLKKFPVRAEFEDNIIVLIVLQ
jgi:hypothetical protein